MFKVKRMFLPGVFLNFFFSKYPIFCRTLKQSSLLLQQAQVESSIVQKKPKNKKTKSKAVDSSEDEVTVSLTEGEVEELEQKTSASPTAEYINETWDRGGRTKLNSLTPLQEKIRKLVNQNPNCVSLVQVGSFYELYFNQAEEYAPKLGIKLAIRNTSNFKVPMAGFPVYQLEKYVKMLVHDLGESVAIVDQVSNGGRAVTEFNTDGLIHRRVSRIVTPGTLIDESFMNFNQNNYLLAISLPPQISGAAGGIGDIKHIELDSELEVGLAWCDVSLGEFNLQQTTLGELMSDITRINPSEIILAKSLENNPFINDHSWLKDLNRYFVRFQKENLVTKVSLTENFFKVGKKSAIRQFFDSTPKKQLTAMQMILGYISVNIPELNPSFDTPKTLWNKNVLQMDPRTREALELNQRLSNNSTLYTLFSTIRRTLTDSGTRMLRQWISCPILDIKKLAERQDYVELFLTTSSLRLNVRKNLSALDDFVRSVQRLSLGVGDIPTHLISIANGLTKAEELRNIMKSETPSAYQHLIQDDFLWNSLPKGLAQSILDTFECEEMVEPFEKVVEEADEDIEMKSNSASLDDIGRSKYDESIEKYRHIGTPVTNKAQTASIFSVKKDYNPQLRAAREGYEHLLLLEKDLYKSFLAEVQQIDPKVKVIQKVSHGKHVDVLQLKGSEASINKVSVSFTESVLEKRKGSMIIKPYKWVSIKEKMEKQLFVIMGIENKIISKLRRDTLDVVNDIREIGRLISFLDVCASFAVLAIENNLVRPTFLKTSKKLEIKNGRHMVVENSLKEIGELFVPNDTKLDVKKERLLVITGPNMGGKSTYLRQNALIVILAQIGSFVPADSCKLGLVDRIFTRIGASDDISRDLSTFMVEMVEISNILHNATEKSLVVVDEIGRGTSGKEGLAIAYGSLLSILNKNKCRTMFATHFGKELQTLLTDDNVDQSSVAYLKTGVRESPGSMNLILDHKLQPGISERSYALEVAKMAGFPTHALAIAERAFQKLNKV